MDSRGRRIACALVAALSLTLPADIRGRAQSLDDPDPIVDAAPDEEPRPGADAGRAPAGAPGAETADGDRGPEVAYEVVVAGDLPEPLRALLREVSEAQRSTDRPPSSLARLQRRASDDLPRLREALRSRGYYDGRVELTVDRRERPVRVTFTVEPGPLYTFGALATEVDGEAPGLDLPELDALGLAIGDPAAARVVLDAQQRLLEAVEAQGFVLATMESPAIIVDHDQRTMEVTYRVRPGPRGRFGETRIEGLTTVERALVDRRLDWRDGDLITPDKLGAARRRLVDTGLFRSVRIEPEEPQGSDPTVPVKVLVTERRHRSIGLGARYRTDEGPGGSIFWEHRNLFGRGEKLSVTLDGSGIGYFLLGSFRKIDFLRLNQAFIADSELRHDDTEAFTSTSASASAGIEREFRPKLVGRGSLAFRYVKIEDVEEGDEGPFGLLSLPLGLSYDTSDDPFDPTRGGRLFVDEEPFVDLLDPQLTFNKLRIDYSHYFRLVEKPRLVFAARGAIGTAMGAERDDIPADERYYAGGGGSIRGFAFQEAGELDDSGDPVGGRSLLEFAGEFRVDITESIGAVAFVDAGGAYESVLPDPGEDVFVGVGTGLRYFSPIGPIRLDVGFPVNRRDEDDAFQIYVSIGQAF